MSEQLAAANERDNSRTAAISRGELRISNLEGRVTATELDIVKLKK